MGSVLSILKNEYNIDLTEQQQKAAQHIDGPCLVLAVPGAGKTLVMISRLAYLILEIGIEPSNILSVTFSRASASDMEKRFEKYFKDKISGKVHFSTIHSLAFQIVREYLNKRGMKYTVIEGHEDKEKNKDYISKVSLLKKINLNINGDYINDDKLNELSSAISCCKNKMLSLDEIQKSDFNVNNFYDIFRKYEEIKEEKNFLDFDDMLTKAYSFLSKDKKLLERYRKKYQYVMCDEAQDTSIVQHKIIQILVNPNNNIFMVADDDQMIYSWRGADSDTLLDFGKIYEGAKFYYMEENFRSTKAIVDTANKFIKSNKKRYKKDITTKNGAGEKIKFINVEDEHEQANTLLQFIIKDGNYKSNIVLYRNNISAIILADTFSRNNIPFYVRESDNLFFTHWVIEDIKAFFNLACDRRNMTAFQRIYYKMRSYLSKTIIKELSKMEVESSVFKTVKEANDLSTFQKKRINDFEDDFNILRHMPPAIGINFIEDNLSYGDYIDENAEKMGYSKTSILIILDNLKIIAEHTPTIKDFLNRLGDLQLIMENSKFNKNKNAVVLSSIHSVKGLEYPSVYIVDLIDEQFPNSTAINNYEKGDNTELEEERRVMYVAITRAKKNLTLFIMNESHNQVVIPSRFIYEIQDITSPKEKKEQQLKVRDRVIHAAFKEGTILRIDGKFIEINFDSYGVKRLSKELCLSKHLLKPVEI